MRSVFWAFLLASCFARLTIYAVAYCAIFGNDDCLLLILSP